MMPKIPDHIYVTITRFINEHEMFWLYDLKLQLGYSGHDERGPVVSALHLSIKRLRDKGAIQCCKNEKSKKQYIRVWEKISFKDVANR